MNDQVGLGAKTPRHVRRLRRYSGCGWHQSPGTDVRMERCGDRTIAARWVCFAWRTSPGCCAGPSLHAPCLHGCYVSMVALGPPRSIADTMQLALTETM